MKNSFFFSVALFVLALFFAPSTLEAQQVTGRNVVFVKFGGSSGQIGAFASKDNKVWYEMNPKLTQKRFTFKETNRDDWSVYLEDKSRGVYIQLDLHTKKIYYSDANTPRREQYNLTKAYAKHDGWITSRVVFGNGSTVRGTFRLKRDGTWAERDSRTKKDTWKFKETHRDDWSIYLRDDSRNMNLQLDMHTKKVMIQHDNESSNRVLYDIIRVN